jgi:putative addiction module component (TIGR02574 family)
MSVETLLQEVKSLSARQQFEFAQRVWGMVECEITPEETEAIDRRLQDHLANPDDVVPWEQVKATLDAKYKK